MVGGDDRVRDLQLQVVDRPELFAIELECVYPEYLGREPRRLPVTGGMRIPEGTQLSAARDRRPSRSPPQHSRRKRQAGRDARRSPTAAAGKARWDYGTLAADDVLLVSVTDTDGVASREPYRVSLAVVRDEVPQVAVRLAGIGTAITPDAILPLVGKMTDDYGLDRAGSNTRSMRGPPCTTTARRSSRRRASARQTRFVRHAGRRPSTGQTRARAETEQRLTLSLKAADRFNLAEERREPAAASSLRSMW